MRMQNQAKLAAESHRGHMAEHMSKCMNWSVTAKPAGLCAAAIFWGEGVLSGVVGEVAISGTALSLPSSYFQGRAKKRVFGPFSGCVMTNFWPCKDFANREQKSSFARGILSPKLCYLTLSSLLFCTNCVDVMTGYLGSNHVHDGFYYLKQ